MSKIEKKTPKIIIDDNEEEEDTDPNKDVITYDLDTKPEDINWKKKWRFTVLHKENLNGRDTIWYSGYDPKIGEYGGWFSGDGIVGMKIKTFEDEIIPKAGRTIQEQTIQELKQMYVLKERKGYIIPGEKESELINTMQGPAIDLNKIELKYPVGLEPKLNGERCLAVLIKNVVIMYSRGKVQWVDARKAFFVKDIKLLLSFLPRGVTLDGEMYGHGTSRQQLNSMIKNPEKFTDKKEINKIAFNIFTYADEKTPAEIRHKNLLEAYKKYLEAAGNEFRIKIVPMITIKNKEQLIEEHMKYKENNYEGSMIYKFANGKKSGAEYETSLYESGKRTGKNAHVYKLKVDITDEGQEEQLEEEGLIIGFYAAKGSQKDAIMFNLLDSRGNQFKCGIEGTIESRQKLYKKALKDKSIVIGKYLEYKYQELSDTGVPTMAVGLNIRNEDDVDVQIVKKFKKLIKKLDISLEEESEDEDKDKEESEDELSDDDIDDEIDIKLHSFYKQLKKLKYKTEIYDDGPKGKYYLFYQEFVDDLKYQKDNPKSKHYDWRCCKVNKKYLENHLGILNCGGHYNNIRIFNGEKDITSDYNMIIDELDPERLIYEDEDESEDDEKPKKKDKELKNEEPKKKDQKIKGIEIDEKRLNSDKKSKENPNPYTLVELKSFAKELQLKKYSQLNKEALIEVIKEKLNIE